MRLPWLSFAIATGVLVPACNGDERESGPVPVPRMAVIEAADRTLDAGPARIEVSVRSGGVHYGLNGRLDPVGGYRLCAVIGAAPGDYFRGKALWLEGRAGTFGTLTTFRALTTRTARCTRRSLWFDDHPPTLELHQDDGAEDFLHAALVALTGMRERTVTTAQARACGDSQCYGIEVDFAALDRKPNERDEDTWTLRPLLRSLGRHPMTLRVGPDGFLDRLAFAASGPSRSKVRVELGLSRFGKEDPVPRVYARAIE